MILRCFAFKIAIVYRLLFGALVTRWCNKSAQKPVRST